MSTRPAPAVPYTALLGKLLQHHREQCGLNQQQVAAALGVLQPAYSRIESGDTSISVTQLRIVARTLRIAPARILNEADQWTQQLRRQGVTVTDEKPVSKVAVAIGLGVLAAMVLALSNSK